MPAYIPIANPPAVDVRGFALTDRRRAAARVNAKKAAAARREYGSHERQLRARKRAERAAEAAGAGQVEVKVRRSRDESAEPLPVLRQRIRDYLAANGPTWGCYVIEALGITDVRFWAAVSNGNVPSHGFQLTFGTPAGWVYAEPKQRGRPRKKAAQAAA